MSLFGTSTTAPAASTTPLFGSTAAAAPKPGGLFGAPAAAMSSGLFGASQTAPAPASAGLFGSTTAPTPASTSSVPLFGSTTTTASPSGGLFGAKTATTAAPAPTGGLFGASTAAPATGSLFGSTAPATGGLFGAKSTTSAAPTLGGGLFGSSTAPAAAATTSFGAPPATAAAPLGLGGIQQQNSSGGGLPNASGTATSSLTGTGDSKDASKDGEWTQAATLIRDLLPLIEDKFKKNREFMEETENMSIDNVAIEEQIDKTRGWIEEVRRDVLTATQSSERIAYLVSTDKTLCDTTKRVQEHSGSANQTTYMNAIKEHLAELCNFYGNDMDALQERVNFLRNRFEKLLTGEKSITMEELDAYFLRCDANVSNAHHHVTELGKEIEEIRDFLIEQGYTQLRKWSTTAASAAAPIASNSEMIVREGAEFFPSQSSLAIIGSSLRAPAAPAPAVGGLGLGTGTSLFGNTGTTSLFGSTATKPAFSGGSLFGATTSTATSSAAATTTTPTTSLFGSTKPATTTTPFASTVANNSSGLLFSSKK